MRIREQEDALFEKWRRESDDFVPDGVVDEEFYTASNPKVVYILKEANRFRGDLRDFIRAGGRPRTWNNITRWTMGIQNLADEIDWEDLASIGEEKRRTVLRTICATNMKKTSGGHTTNNSLLCEHAKRDRDFFQSQFAIYNPGIVICCGSTVSNLLHQIVKFEKEPKWKMTRRGIWYHRQPGNCAVIGYPHPEARVADNLLYYGLIDAVREIKQHCIDD